MARPHLQGPLCTRGVIESFSIRVESKGAIYKHFWGRISDNHLKTFNNQKKDRSLQSQGSHSYFFFSFQYSSLYLIFIKGLTKLCKYQPPQNLDLPLSVGHCFYETFCWQFHSIHMSFVYKYPSSPMYSQLSSSAFIVALNPVVSSCGLQQELPAFQNSFFITQIHLFNLQVPYCSSQ